MLSYVEVQKTLYRQKVWNAITALGAYLYPHRVLLQSHTVFFALYDEYTTTALVI